MVVSRLQYIRRRLLLAVPIIFFIIVLNFLLIQIAPGDAADVLAGEAGSATPEYMDQLRRKFGLDQPIYVQLLTYVSNVATFDLGFSFRHNKPVSELILSRLGPTLLLMVPVLLISVSMGILLGAIAARYLNRWQDKTISTVVVLTYATPVFWAGLMLIVLFSVKLGWFPTSGMEKIAAFHTGLARIIDIAHHMVLPVITLTLFYIAVIEQNTMDYVTTARSKGLGEKRVLWGHILRNACLPVLTMAGIQAGALLGGAVVVETVFSWPGLGLLAYESLFARDLNLLLGIFFISACLVVLVNLAVDLLYASLDPRIELK